MELKTVGSVCSGIEAASVAWVPLGFEFQWFSEDAVFPSRLLKERYPSVPNAGDMRVLPQLLSQGELPAPDIICGGTPCQAFSLAGLKSGLDDQRGVLMLKFVDIIEANDRIRLSQGKARTVVFWENVEGVLTDKTGAFGCFVSALAGTDEPIRRKKWEIAGLVRGKKRSVAWRVLDAKYFGIPQQRRRLYVVAGGEGFSPESVLFEEIEQTHGAPSSPCYPAQELRFEKGGHSFEVFRAYTDCLYSAYGTKWNGNAAAFNGSLYVVQDGRLRRFSPLECERLMGFPDGYTDLSDAKRTNRYQVVGNSWAVPVVRWIGKRIKERGSEQLGLGNRLSLIEPDGFCADGSNLRLNVCPAPMDCAFGSMEDIVSPDASEDIYISPVGCFGIIRRARERSANINNRLKETLLAVSSQMPSEEIERRSRVQKRGRFSTVYEAQIKTRLGFGEREHSMQMSLFE